MQITITGTPKEVAALTVELRGQRPGTDQPEGSAKHYDPATRDDTWLRFELIAPEEIKDEFYEILERYPLNRRELAVLVSSLRVRSGFSLSDFDI